MSDEELLRHKKIGPEIAAKYLQGGYTAQELRLDAQEGISPFITAKKGKGRYSYRVNVGRLIKFKHGELSPENY